MSSNLRYAVVGCGAIARHAHVPALLEQKGAEISALVDPAADAAKLIADRHGLKVPVYSSLEELLAKSKPDVVDLCSPGFVHFDQAKMALEAGCHVLVEKPPTPTVAAAQSLVALAKDKRLKIGGIFNYRYRDLVMELKSHVDAGTLGALAKVYITHHGPLIFTDAPWLWNEKKSKYILWEFGIHFLDILVHLLGPHEKLLHVLPFEQPSIGHTTDLEVSIQFKSGAVGRLEITSDSLRHSSVFTHINAYGTGMDAFVRWFPPTVRLTSGQTTPMKLLADEVKAAWTIGEKLLRGTFIKHRNISHYRTIDAYTRWIRDGVPYPMELESVIPTIRLLEDIERQIPSYAEAARGGRREAALS